MTGAMSSAQRKHADLSEPRPSASKASGRERSEIRMRQYIEVAVRTDTGCILMHHRRRRDQGIKKKVETSKSQKVEITGAMLPRSGSMPTHRSPERQRAGPKPRIAHRMHLGYIAVWPPRTASPRILVELNGPDLLQYDPRRNGHRHDGCGRTCTSPQLTDPHQFDA